LGKKLDNQNGLTLLEVLLSIVLLTIVLTSFAGFFSQSAMFVKKNEDKLSTSQTAQQIVNLIEVNITKSMLQAEFDKCESPCVITLFETDLETLTGLSIKSPYNISAEFTQSIEGLVKVKVAIIDSDHPESSSGTFTYIRR
jgi:prepilin-type N-terminal cleavage/methylation domain-containing protein